ncbi:hypothetical protein ACU4I5_31495 (plasmid) [Ensifer adhaerens]
MLAKEAASQLIEKILPVLLFQKIGTHRQEYRQRQIEGDDAGIGYVVEGAGQVRRGEVRRAHQRKPRKNGRETRPERDDEEQEGSGIAVLVDEKVRAGALRGHGHGQGHAQHRDRHRQDIVKTGIRPAPHRQDAGDNEGREHQEANGEQPGEDIRQHGVVAEIDEIVDKDTDHAPDCGEPHALCRIVLAEELFYFGRKMQIAKAPRDLAFYLV